MKSIRTIAAVPMILATLAFYAGDAQAYSNAEAHRLRAEDRRRCALLESLSKVALNEKWRVSQAVGRINQSGRGTDRTWQGRMSNNARMAMQQYERAIRAFCRLENEANAYIRWGNSIRGTITTNTFGAQQRVRFARAQIQELRTDMNRKRSFWYRLGLQF